MSRRLYLILIVAVLAAAAYFAARPELFVGSTDSNKSGTDIVTAPDDTSADEQDPFGLRKIDFDITNGNGSSSDAATTTVRAAVSPLEANRLIVPRMGVDADVIMEDTDAALKKGLWHIPGSAVPGTNGNIVISAHRWLRKPPDPRTFYLINTMQVGDPIYYEYKGSRYTYKVTKTYVVNPEDVQILSQDENKLTLFTCTPLYSTKQRFVVEAKLEAVDNL